MRVLSYRDRLARLDVEPVAVGFSPVEPIAALARHLDWPDRFLSDPDRILYTRLGLGRAGAGEVFTPGTRAIYREAVERGVQVERPVEDIRQLGGDAIAADGTVVIIWRPTSPDDRPSVTEMMAAVEARFA